MNSGGLEVSVLGPLEVRLGGQLVPVDGTKPRAVLTLLGLYPNQLVTAGTLAALLWGEDPPRTARKALQTHISTLRRVLGEGYVRTAGAGWVLPIARTDASRFAGLAERGRELARRGEHPAAVTCFDEALALWRGSPELCLTARSRSEAARWAEEEQALAEDRFAALLACGHGADLIGELEQAVGAAPLRERRWALLCHALYRASRQADALAAFHRARHALDTELGVEPGPELRRMQSMILTQDTALEHSPVPVQSGRPQVTTLSWASPARRGPALTEALMSYRDGWLIARGSCISVGASSPPYSPLPAILNGIARTPAGLALLQRAARVWPGVLRIPGVDETGPAADITTGLGQLHLFESLAWVLSQAGPVVLAVEDLHLADEATLALITYLQHNLHSGQVVLILASRQVTAVPDRLTRLTGNPARQLLQAA
jgi:DNA-binding SARP family transcriptional activator